MMVANTGIQVKGLAETAVVVTRCSFDHLLCRHRNVLALAYLPETALKGSIREGN